MTAKELVALQELVEISREFAGAIARYPDTFARDIPAAVNHSGGWDRWMRALGMAYEIQRQAEREPQP